MALSIWHVAEVRPEAVFIVDENLPGTRSVTNDAERVVLELFSSYGQRRFFYRDSMGQWDELCHIGVRFTGFAPGLAGLPPPAIDIERS